MIGIAINAALLVHFLQLIVEAADQTACIPNYFRYIKDEESEVFSGHIEIPSPPKGISLQLSARLSIAVILPTKYVGRLELAESREKSVNAIQKGRPLKYNIHFPLHRPIPTVTGLWFNNERLCYGPRATGQIVTSITLNHTLYPPGVMVVSSDDEDVISTHSNVDNTLWQPVTIEPIKSSVQPVPTQSSVQPVPTQSSSTRPVPTQTTVSRPVPTQPVPTQPVTTQTVSPLIDTSETSYDIGQPFQDCGRSSNPNRINQLIAGGVKTSKGQWPWLAAIFIVRYNFEFQCAGTLVTNTHIITAAHCFQFGNVTVPIGALSVSLGRYRLRDWEEEGSVNRHVASYKLHPDYRPRFDTSSQASADSDLAVLVLRERVEFSSVIKPICLWPGSTSLDVVVGRSGSVVGWGRDEFGNPYLQEPRLSIAPVVSQEVCLWSNPEFVLITSNRTFCAGSRNGSGPCNGDSGSGFVIYNANTERYYLRGVVSLSLLDRSSMSCDLTQFVVYVDVAKYLDWIREEIST
ncbi:serine protease gd isoform X2 [Ptiloglossa arizonensis]